MGVIFLSHDHEDKKIADVIAHTISKITLDQLTIWFSSDSSPFGGMVPGLWFDQLREKLQQSDAILVLLTPTSLNKLWLYFESGFGEANANCEVIPIAIGLNSYEDIPFPLALYQSYLLTDFTSFKEFSQKLLSKFSIKFDEDMTENVLREAMSDILNLVPTKEIEESEMLVDPLREIKDHIDKRLLQFIPDLPIEDDRNNVRKSNYLYEVQYDINLKAFQSTSIPLEIKDQYTVQDILNNIYFMLNDEVPVYSYLENWILREKKSNIFLVIREINSLIPAKFIFKPGTEWEVVELTEPYSPEFSNSRQHDWYRKSIGDKNS